MRELGYSKRQARGIVSHGFKGLAPEGDGADDMSEELVSLLKRTLINLTEKDMS